MPNLLSNANKMVLFLEKIFSALIMRFLRQKYQKVFKFGKIQQYYEGVFFRKKKRVHLFRSFLYKNGKPQNMPVVAVRHLNTLRLKDSLSVECFNW